MLMQVRGQICGIWRVSYIIWHEECLETRSRAPRFSDTCLLRIPSLVLLRGITGKQTLVPYPIWRHHVSSWVMSLASLENSPTGGGSHWLSSNHAEGCSLTSGFCWLLLVSYPCRLDCPRRKTLDSRCNPKPRVFLKMQHHGFGSHKGVA